MAANTVTKQTLTYLLGICVPSFKRNATKIRITRMDFDNHLLTYFTKYEFVYAVDPEKRCKIGDTVLIQNLPEKLTRIITHKIVDVVFPVGDIVDPVSGKTIVAGKYRETIQEDAKLYGELESMYKYDKATPRGSMENKRDFSNRKIYVKYDKDLHNSDPCAVNPR
ncbi:28S ribosomal protein S17, mitochondrial [Anthophora quadrimaculata]